MEEQALMSEDSRLGRRFRCRQLGCALIVAGMLMIVGWTAVTGGRLLTHARSLQAHIQSLESLAGGRDALEWGDLARARSHLAGARTDLEEIEFSAGTFLPAGRLLQWVPRRGGDLAAAADLLEVAVGVATAGDRVMQALSPAVELLERSEVAAGVEPKMIEQLLSILVEAQPAIEAARADLSVVAAARARIDTGTLSSETAGMLETLDRSLPLLETGLQVADAAPWLLGADDTRTYLVLVQNNHELRATGGFLSGVGELRISGGRLASVKFRDSYDVDNFQVSHDFAPQDLQEHLSGELLFFRDTNWDPDFPISARTAMAVYARDQGVEADGVLALDLVALQYLLGAVGPIRVAALPDPLTAENVLETIQAEWGDSSGGGIDLEWWEQRKDFMGPLASAILERISGGEELDLAKLLEAVRRALEEKHILLYISDMDSAALIHELRWDGALPEHEGAGDMLVVVDSNVGFNKVDANVERTIRYQVDLGSEAAPRAHLTLTYHNSSPEQDEPCTREPRYGARYADLMTGCYWSYVRVYVPYGSRWLGGNAGSLLQQAGQEDSDSLSAPGPATSVTGGGLWSVWASFIELAPGEQQTVSFEYQLPAWVVNLTGDGFASYQLRVQKQPGTEAVPLEVSVTLPGGAVPVSATPAGLAKTLVSATNLRVDREFALAFRREAHP